MSRKIDRRPGGIIDEDTRRQSLKRRLDGLERDNYQEVPELELLGTVIKPRRTSEVGDRDGTIANKKPRLRSKKEILRQLYIKKSLKTLIDESRIELVSEDVPTYLTAAASPSKFPPKKFCSVYEIYCMRNTLENPGMGSEIVLLR
ncbi:1104_t:CDS:2 [Paraglomus occultum]|uniref:1104_t:CDS:1 n=1 Tax=Paraglomus occultum TaxID=144539 RepID=A0A9N9G852_9GLOM|nr:1104_t:CDS:2 [Paraglomus occultum]